ncbi:MAG TPA: gephyrin-like molybdotransferase Glp [Trichormus sp.]
MLSYEEALVQILERANPLPEQELPLDQLFGCVLGEPLRAPFQLPQFDSSAVDGFGVMLSDTESASEQKPVRLKLTGEIQAGSKGDLALTPGCAIKILTGGIVPETVDAVVMREYCTENNGGVDIAYAPSPGENVRRSGSEFEEGVEVLPEGMRVTPPVVGMLATLGYAKFAVHRRPRLAIVTTGDELIKPGQPLGPGQIYDSNSYALKAAIRELGIDECKSYFANDTKESTMQAFKQAFEDSDVIISGGGVSVGDYDFVKDVLEEMGVQTVFWRIAMKPGKPVYFGVLEASAKHPQARSHLVFGLPGNPVSVLVTFHQLVRPALLKMMGSSIEAVPHRVTATLRGTLKKKPGRLDFVRGHLRVVESGHLEVTPTRGQESNMMSGLARANSLIHFPAEAERLDDGAQVTADVLTWWD